MADNQRQQQRAAEQQLQQRAAEQQLQPDEDLEMSAETIEELERELKDKEMDRNMREAWDRFYGKEKSEEDVETFSGGGIVRGTRAQVRGRRFSGVF